MIDNVKGLVTDIAPVLGAEDAISVWDIAIVAVVFLAALGFLVRLHGGFRKRRDAPACSCCGGGCGSRSHAVCGGAAPAVSSYAKAIRCKPPQG
jgi:hypothetical protein